MTVGYHWPNLPNSTTAPNYLGLVGGGAVVWQPADTSLTRPNNATTYTAGDAIGSSSAILFSWSNTPFFRSPGSSALITGARIVMSAAGITTGSVGSTFLYLYNAPPTIAGLSDNSPFPLLYSPDDQYRQGLPLTATTWVPTTQAAGSTLVEAFAQPSAAQVPIIAQPTSQNLYGVLVAGAAWTPVANAVVQIYLSAVLD
jgi:hypothetical protein